MQWYDNRVTAFFVSTFSNGRALARCSRGYSSACHHAARAYAGAADSGRRPVLHDACARAGRHGRLARHGTLFIEEAGAMAFGILTWRAWCRLSQAVAAQRKKIKATPLCGIASVCQKYHFNFTLRAGSTHKIEFAEQIHKFRACISEFIQGRNVLAGCFSSVFARKRGFEREDARKR